jgi:hypothetical protein
MQYRTLGRTGVEVSNQCLGAMMFGAMGNTDHDECVAMIHTAIDAGINFIDTADVYSQGESEEIVGKALRGRRDDVVLATKCFNPMGDDRNRRGGSRRWIVRAVEESLGRRGTDHIDLDLSVARSAGSLPHRRSSTPFPTFDATASGEKETDEDACCGVRAVGPVVPGPGGAGGRRGGWPRTVAAPRRARRRRRP